MISYTSALIVHEGWSILWSCFDIAKDLRFQSLNGIALISVLGYKAEAESNLTYIFICDIEKTDTKLVGEHRDKHLGHGVLKVNVCGSSIVFSYSLYIIFLPYFLHYSFSLLVSLN